MRRSLLLAILAACSVEPATPVAWDVGVRPVAPDGSDPAWVARVDAARDAWVTLLRDCAPDAFDGGAGTQPVELVTSDEMVADTGRADVIGYTFHDRILVEGTPDDLAAYPTYAHRTLMHEMGHALGLAHVTVADDPTSVMHAGDDDESEPDAADVAAACVARSSPEQE